MTRIKFFYLAIGLSAVIVMAALVAEANVFGSDLRGQTDIADLPKALGLPPQSTQYHLYSGAINGSGRALVPLERQVDVFNNGSLAPSATYGINKDHSTENARFHENGVITESFVYYPDADSIGHLHIKSKFFADGKLQDEDVRHIDGSPEKRTTILASGEKHVVEYAADGVSILDDALYVPDACCSDLIVKVEKRFRDNQEHQLQHSDVLNADGTRSVFEFDEHLNQVRTEFWPQDHKIPGTVITEFYPDTLHTRFVSRCDRDWNTIEYLRTDGTLEKRVKISSTSVRVVIFDSTGQKPLFEQSWGMVMTSVDSVMVWRRYLSDLSEFDDHGNKVRTLSYRSDDALLYEIKFDATVGGIKYDRAIFFYDAAGFLKTSKYFLLATDDMSWFNQKPDREDAFTPAANIRQATPSSMELAPLDLDPSLPIPPVQRSGH
ncbi:MAG: hypothetical protein P4L53_23915 [Candidatus Obscuribacterales bacterium]|nr:hypothetical protein [Candidatus Obscuribacterales bacterium]